jgi:hypothetical protein
LPCIDEDIRVYFRDVQDHVRRVQSRVDALRDALNSVFQLSSLLEQQRVGTITRQLAAWAAILAVPTAIAGIYGMNFQNMPELNMKYGYFVVLGVIIRHLPVAIRPLPPDRQALARANLDLARFGPRACEAEGHQIDFAAVRKLNSPAGEPKRQVRI